MLAQGGGASQSLVPRLDSLLVLWRQHYSSRPIPARSLLKPADLAPWAEHTALVGLGPGRRYRVEHFGFALIRRFGRESTGHFVDDLAPDIAESLIGMLDKSTLSAAPVPGNGSVQLGRDAAMFSDLVLPLARDAERIAEFLVASYEIRGKRPNVP